MCTKITYASYGSKTELVNEQFDINISRQSVYLSENELSPQYIYNKEQEILKKSKNLKYDPVVTTIMMRNLYRLVRKSTLD